MFGYVKPFVPDLYVREFELYKAVYCGICREMKRRTGRLSTVALSYDMVFLAIARMAAESETLNLKKCRCTAIPLKKKHMICDSRSIDYCARASAILTYRKILDDVSDERGLRRLGARLALPFAKRAAKHAKLDRLGDEVARCLERLSSLEHERVASVDEPADAFGELLGEVFAHGLEGDCADALRDVGYHLGRFIYAADAAEDWERDIARGGYNPFILLYGEDYQNESFRREIHGALTYSASLAAEALGRIDFTQKDAAEHILINTLTEGLMIRIGFLIGKGAPDSAFPLNEHGGCKECASCRKHERND